MLKFPYYMILERIKSNKTLFGIFFCAYMLFGIFFWNLCSSHYLYEKPDGLYSASNVWGDLPGHMALGSSFALRGLSKTLNDNPVFSGTSVSYPFVPDYISGLLMSLGASPRNAFLWPTFLAIMAFILCLWVVSFKITKSAIGSFFTPIIFLFGGSLWGLFYFISDYIREGKPLLYALLHQSTNYSYLKGANVVFSNVISDFILPQRAFIFGLTIGLVAVYFLWRYWEGKTQRDLLIFSLVLCALPLVHLHTFISLGLIAFAMFCGEIILVYRKRAVLDMIVKRWLIYFGLPIIVLAAAQMWLIFPTDKSPGAHLGFFGEANPIIFWFKNLLIYIPVFIAAYLVAPMRFRTFFNGAIFLFVVGNAVLFQPNAWDNTKFIVIFFLISCVMTAFLLEHLWKNGWLRRAASLCLIVLMIPVGVLVSIRELNSSTRLFSRADMELADFIRRDTPKDSVFLTGLNHNNPVFSLAGRSVVQGYPGWIWSYGLDGSVRKTDMQKVYENARDAGAIINKYNISHIIVDAGASKSFKIDPLLKDTYETVYSSGSTLVLKTK